MNNDVANISAVLLTLTKYLAATGNAKVLSAHLAENAEVLGQNAALADAAALLRSMSEASAKFVK